MTKLIPGIWGDHPYLPGEELRFRELPAQGRSEGRDDLGLEWESLCSPGPQQAGPGMDITQMGFTERP